MKNKKGFTLVELLAVIVVLAIILTIAVGSVTSAINKTKEATKYAAAKEIVAIAEAYMEENNLPGVTIGQLITAGYLESDATNPRTGENGFTNPGDKGQLIIKDDSFESLEPSADTPYYSFDGYAFVKEKDSTEISDTIKNSISDALVKICGESKQLDMDTGICDTGENEDYFVGGGDGSGSEEESDEGTNSDDDEDITDEEINSNPGDETDEDINPDDDATPEAGNDGIFNIRQNIVAAAIKQIKFYKENGFNTNCINVKSLFGVEIPNSEEKAVVKLWITQNKDLDVVQKAPNKFNSPSFGEYYQYSIKNDKSQYEVYQYFIDGEKYKCSY